MVKGTSQRWFKTGRGTFSSWICLFYLLLIQSQVHIHGGAWTMGDKDCFYPYQKMLIEEDNWVRFNNECVMILYFLISTKFRLL